MTAPVTSSSAEVTNLQQALANLDATINGYTSQLATVAASNNPGVTYTIAGRAGSETVSMGEYVSFLSREISSLTTARREILKQLQDLQPFQVTLRHRPRGPGWGRWKLW